MESVKNDNLLKQTCFEILQDPNSFARYAGDLRLRRYQVVVINALTQSVRNHQGLSFVVMFPRQSGKNELQAQIEAYLMTLLSMSPNAEIVKVSPTWRPQTLNAMRRLQRVLETNKLTRAMGWAKEQGYIYRLGSARIYFFSGQPEANIVGATASTLLEVDEAQDVEISKFDKDIAPMAASTNATRIYWGTAWTSRTLLARELRAAREEEARDGIKRTFVLTADQVAAELPAYGVFVDGQVRKLGRQNPMIKTQFFSEEIDAEGGMFPALRQALIHGAHARQIAPMPGQQIAFLIDVAGEDENAANDSYSLSNPGRDSTTLTVVEIDPSTLADDLIKAATYRVLFRQLWTGAKHTSLYAVIKSLAETWQPKTVVIDATGIGAGLASFLDKALPGKVIPFTFNSATKSKLGWDFLSIIDSGRFKDHKETDPLKSLFFQQLGFCTYEILTGPDRKMKWSVPDGTRDPATGELMHDDLILSAALVAVLDQEDHTLTGPTLVIPFADPLEELDHGF